LTRLYTALKDVSAVAVPPSWDDPYARRFKDAMNDDFNTPIAIAVLFDMAAEINRSGSVELACQLMALAGILGLLQRDPVDFLHGEQRDSGPDVEAIEVAIAQRTEAKASRNYARADHIRLELQQKGILLEDSPSGTVWRRL